MIKKILLTSTLRIKILILFIILGFSSMIGVSQSFNKIDLKEISERRVRKYIVSKAIDQMHDFSLIHASWKNDFKESDFHLNEKIFYLKFKLSTVWAYYRHTSLVNNWNGQFIRFGLLIKKSTNSVFYSNSSSFPEVDTGQVYFLGLRLLKGFYNVPVAFEIIDIDQKQQVMQFSYIDNNKSQGKQKIQFFDNGGGRTRIVHKSYFRSESSLRDDILYPYFHKKFVREFHRNMKKRITKGQHALAALK